MAATLRTLHLMLYVTMCIINCVNGKDYVKLEEIPDYPGFYFVPQYWLSISSENWRVLYNIPLRPLDLRVNLINKLYTEIETSKSGKLWIYLNEPRLDLLKHSYQTMHKFYGQLSDLLLHKSRQKRGLFDSVGHVLKMITGNMDSNDEAYYNEKINTIAMDNKHIYQLEKDQLTIIQNTLWAVNKTTLDMQENQDTLSKSYKYLEKVAMYNKDLITNLTLNYKKQGEIMEELNLAQELVSETNEILQMLYVAIDTARLGRISSYLIKPKEMLEIMESVKNSLQIGDSLPVTVSRETIYSYYDLVSISAYFVNNDLRFVMDIPLRHIASRYHLFKVIQVPDIKYSQDPKSKVYAQMFIFPEKTTNYIAISENLQYYIMPSEKELQQCTPLPNVICKNIHITYPVNQNEGNHARCEIDVFKNISSPNCNFRIAKIITPVWENIPYTNTWIFAAVPLNEQVTVTCKNDQGVMTYISDIKLHRKGKLTLAEDCVATGSSFTLLSRGTKSNTISDYQGLNIIIPKVNLTPSNDDLKILQEYDNFTKHHSEIVLKHVTHQMNDLNIASIRITKLREIMQSYEPSNFNSEFYDDNNLYNVLLLTIVILLICIYSLAKCGVIKRIRKCLATPENTNESPLALEDVTPRLENNESSNNETPRPRRSIRLMRIRT